MQANYTFFDDTPISTDDFLNFYFTFIITQYTRTWKLKSRWNKELNWGWSIVDTVINWKQNIICTHQLCLNIK